MGVNPPAYRIVIAQLCLTLVMTVIGLSLVSVDKALSMLFGGLTSSAAHGSFIWFYFYRSQDRQTPESILRTAYRAEISKLGVTLSFCLITLLVFKDLDFLYFIAALFLAQLVGWVAPLLFKRV